MPTAQATIIIVGFRANPLHDDLPFDIAALMALAERSGVPLLDSTSLPGDNGIAQFLGIPIAFWGDVPHRITGLLQEAGAEQWDARSIVLKDALAAHYGPLLRREQAVRDWGALRTHARTLGMDVPTATTVLILHQRPQTA